MSAKNWNLWKNNTDHWMVDVETTGLDPRANAITSIALVKFDFKMDYWDWIDLLKYKEADITKFHYRVNYVSWDHRVDPETMKWRKENNVDEKELDIKHSITCERLRALLEMHFIRPATEQTVLWAWPPSFDIEFLAHCIFRGHRFPVSYKNIMDARSLWRMVHSDSNVPSVDKKLKEREEALAQALGKREKHNALHDCYWQIGELLYVVA